MSAKNVRGSINLIMGKNGHYELYDGRGMKILSNDIFIRVTQKYGELDKFLLHGVCNVFNSVEELKEYIGKGIGD